MPILHTNLINPNTLNLTIECPKCNGQTEMQVPAEQFVNWQRGQLIQDAFPNLTTDEREAMMTGICPKCWEAMFADEDDDDLGECTGTTSPDPANYTAAEDAHIDQSRE